MSANSRRRDDCRLCGSRDLEPALNMPATPVGDDYLPADRLDAAQELFPLDLYFCRKCAHLQLLDVVDPSLLFRNYTFLSAGSAKLVEHFRSFADTVSARAAAGGPKLVVEIGSNDGTLLRFFKEKGMEVLGVDPAEAIAQTASAAGIPTLARFFTPALAKEILAGHGPASIVAANNVFAHIDDLAGVASTLIYTAGFDPLRDEGKAYADRLTAAGVKTIHREFESLIHGFAARLDAGLAADCTGLSVDGGKLKAVRPVYAGKAFATIEFAGAPQIISVRPNVMTLGGRLTKPKDAKRYVDIFLATDFEGGRHVARVSDLE